MKQWVPGLLVIAGCQAVEETSTVEQALGNVCNINTTTPKTWKPGQYIPTVPLTTTIVTLKYQSQWRSYAVDPALNKIYWIFAMTPSHGVQFLAQIASWDRVQVAIRNPPPPRCPPQTICGDDWLAAGIASRIEEVVQLADMDLDACYQ